MRGAALLAALEPLQVWYSVVLVADVFFAFLFLTALLFLLRWLELKKIPNILVAGLALGLASYFRPVGLYGALFLTIALAVFLFWKREISKRNLVSLGLFILTAWVTILPWQIHNFYVFDDFSFSSLSISNFFDFAAPATLSIQERRHFDDVTTELRSQLKKEAPDPNYVESFKNSDYILGRSFDIIKQYPVAYLKAYLLGGVNTFLFSGNYHFMLQRYNIIVAPPDGLSFSLVLAQGGVKALFKKILETITTPYVFIAFSGKIIWIIFTLGSLWGAWLKKNQALGFIFLSSVIYFVLANIPMGLSIEARHRYMLNPLIFLFFFGLCHRIKSCMFPRKTFVETKPAGGMSGFSLK